MDKNIITETDLRQKISSLASSMKLNREEERRRREEQNQRLDSLLLSMRLNRQEEMKNRQEEMKKRQEEMQKLDSLISSMRLRRREGYRGANGLLSGFGLSADSSISQMELTISQLTSRLKMREAVQYDNPKTMARWDDNQPVVCKRFPPRSKLMRPRQPSPSLAAV